MKRRFIASLVLLALLLSLCACGSGGTLDEVGGSVNDSAGVSTETAAKGSADLNADAVESNAQPETDSDTDAGSTMSVVEESSYSSQRTEAEMNHSTETETEGTGMQLVIGNQTVTVDWEDNESVEFLTELCADNPLTIQMSMYGGFEQVGSIGTSLPRNDKQTTTSAGDIVLYSGNQIVIFYGSNSWAYTRLGKITDPSGDGLSELLGNGDVTITLSGNL